MQLAVLIIDMLRDTFTHDYPITPHARAIVPAINRLTEWARSKDVPIIFACDSFLEDDFIFQGHMKPHSIRGTDGARVAQELVQGEGDTFLPKRRFSAFFKTDLDQTLRLWKVDTVAIAGIATNFCVLDTAFDALSHDFRAIILEDACAAYSPSVHSSTLDNYRNNPLYPLFRILTLEQLIQEYL